MGILHRPARPARTAVVLVVGGPQYRVGSHRQFILLARHLAGRGFPVLRFDCRGMGDSSGRFPGFEHLADDIAAACAALLGQLPGTRQIGLWGLCDGASAALMYGQPSGVPIAGLFLANPWVRSETTLAQTYIRHYYWQRLLSRDFWRKILAGHLDIRRVVHDLADNLRAGANDPATQAPPGFVRRMRDALAQFKGDVVILLSGNDFTAAEFSGVAALPDWQALLQRPGISQHRIDTANHTFSKQAWRDEVADLTAQWLARLEAATGTQPGG